MIRPMVEYAAVVQYHKKEPYQKAAYDRELQLKWSQNPHK